MKNALFGLTFFAKQGIMYEVFVKILFFIQGDRTKCI